MPERPPQVRWMDVVVLLWIRDCREVVVIAHGRYSGCRSVHRRCDMSVLACMWVGVCIGR